MEPEYILFGFIAILFIYFGIGPGSRLLKKKSHHYIVPPSDEKDPDWHPIEFSDYSKYIYINPSEPAVTTQHVVNINDQAIGLDEIQVEAMNNWFKVEAPLSNFDHFHSAIMIYNDINGGDVYGFCKHKEDSPKDYIVKQAEDFEYLLGVFRTNGNFAIHIPSMDKHPKGNISISSAMELDFNEVLRKLPTQI